MWLACEFLVQFIMGENGQIILLTNISEEEGLGNLSITKLSPDLGPDFNNQVWMGLWETRIKKSLMFG